MAPFVTLLKHLLPSMQGAGRHEGTFCKFLPVRAWIQAEESHPDLGAPRKPRMAVAVWWYEIPVHRDGLLIRSIIVKYVHNSRGREGLLAIVQRFENLLGDSPKFIRLRIWSARIHVDFDLPCLSVPEGKLQ